MSVTIKSKNNSIDLGYAGFNILRTKVAELTAPDIYNHYEDLSKGIFLFGDEREKFFEIYNEKTVELDKKYNGEKSDILDFLYASDCDGEMDVEHCKAIYEVIKDCDSNMGECVKFKDFKELIKDCIDENCNMIWF